MSLTAKSRLQQYIQDFSGERGLKMFGGPFFGGLGQTLLLARPWTLGNFQKFAWELLKIWKIIEKFSEKCKIFTRFLFFARAMGKIRNIIYVRYNGEGSWASPRSYKIFNNFIKNSICSIWVIFPKFRKSLPQICSKTIK